MDDIQYLFKKLGELAPRDGYTTKGPGGSTLSCIGGKTFFVSYDDVEFDPDTYEAIRTPALDDTLRDAVKEMERAAPQTRRVAEILNMAAISRTVVVSAVDIRIRMRLFEGYTDIFVRVRPNQSKSAENLEVWVSHDEYSFKCEVNELIRHLRFVKSIWKAAGKCLTE
jgi:hypothetical protein